MKNEDKVRQLTQKLEEQNDISLEEADQIYSLFSGNARGTTLNPHSHAFNDELSNALQDWYNAVAQKIEQGYRGNFVFTIVFSENEHFNKLSKKAQQAIKEHGNFEDRCDILVVNEKTYSALPYKHLFTQGAGDSQSRPYFIMGSDRAGMLYYPIKVKDKTYTQAGF